MKSSAHKCDCKIQLFIKQHTHEVVQLSLHSIDANVCSMILPRNERFPSFPAVVRSSELSRYTKNSFVFECSRPMLS